MKTMQRAQQRLRRKLTWGTRARAHRDVTASRWTWQAAESGVCVCLCALMRAQEEERTNSLDTRAHHFLLGLCTRGDAEAERGITWLWLCGWQWNVTSAHEVLQLFTAGSGLAYDCITSSGTLKIIIPVMINWLIKSEYIQLYKMFHLLFLKHIWFNWRV